MDQLVASYLFSPQALPYPPPYFYSASTVNLLLFCAIQKEYSRLEDDPRSTPGHSKVLDPIRAIMKLMVIASMVCVPGLTEELLRCYVDV